MSVSLRALADRRLGCKVAAQAILSLPEMRPGLASVLNTYNHNLFNSMILIIDNYDSFTYNLVHLVAEATGEYQVVRNDEISVEEAKALSPEGILISPGPGRPDEAGVSEDLVRELGAETPVLGVCLGHQAIGEVFGAKVVHAPTLMHGKTSKIFHDGKSIFEEVASGFTATRYHSLILERDTIPEELEISARTTDGIVMGLRHRTQPLEGIQFHPESILTDVGAQLIRNWLRTHEKKDVSKTAN